LLRLLVVNMFNNRTNTGPRFWPKNPLAKMAKLAKSTHVTRRLEGWICRPLFSIFQRQLVMLDGHANIVMQMWMDCDRIYVYECYA